MFFGELSRFVPVAFRGFMPRIHTTVTRVDTITSNGTRISKTLRDGEQAVVTFPPSRRVVVTGHGGYPAVDVVQLGQGTGAIHVEDQRDETTLAVNTGVELSPGNVLVLEPVYIGHSSPAAIAEVYDHMGKRELTIKVRNFGRQTDPE